MRRVSTPEGQLLAIIARHFMLHFGMVLSEACQHATMRLAAPMCCMHFT